MNSNLENKKKTSPRSERTVKHIVLSSGGIDGIIMYGSIKTLMNRGYFRMDDVQTIHAVSAGALIAVMLMLGYSTEDMDDYIVKRPWHRAISKSEINLTDVLTRKGLVDSRYILELLRPLVEACDEISEPFDTITLSEFERAVGHTRLYMYTVDMNTYPMNATEISAESHPELPLAIALQMTCCIPMLFTPILHDGGCYVDGGLATKCPVQYALARIEDPAELLVFTCENGMSEGHKITEETTMFEYAYHAVMLMNNSTTARHDTIEESKVAYVRCFNADMRSVIDTWYDCMHNEKKRYEYLCNGAKFANIFLGS